MDAEQHAQQATPHIRENLLDINTRVCGRSNRKIILHCNPNAYANFQRKELDNNQKAKIADNNNDGGVDVITGWWKWNL